MSAIKGIHNWFLYLGEDEELEIEGTVKYCVTPGDPGCRYTPNGDGWPPSPPECEFYDPRITKFNLDLPNCDTIFNLILSVTPEMAEALFTQTNPMEWEGEIFDELEL